MFMILVYHDSCSCVFRIMAIHNWTFWSLSYFSSNHTNVTSVITYYKFSFIISSHYYGGIITNLQFVRDVTGKSGKCYEALKGKLNYLTWNTKPSTYTSNHSDRLEPCLKALRFCYFTLWPFLCSVTCVLLNKIFLAPSNVNILF